MSDVSRASLDALNDLPVSADAEQFLEPDDAAERIRRMAAAYPDTAHWVRIGESEEGRPIDGVVLGRGDRHVSLLAGNHADEPVGPDFLRRFVSVVLNYPDECSGLLDSFRLFIVPQTNPDGAFRNRTWRQAWGGSGTLAPGDNAGGIVTAYLRHAVREPPGRDIEFGFPDMRPENRAAAAWLRKHGPFVLHGSLHGMGISAGALLLIEKHWGYRAALLQERFRQAVQAEDLPFYDRNRQGEKGFFYLGPGFWTTPEGSAMRAFFEARGDTKTAALFRSSSMEYIRSLGGDPLCYVTELPLFLVREMSSATGSQQIVSKLRLRIARGEHIDEEMEQLGLCPLPLAAALRMQLRTLSAALEQVVAGEG